MEADSQHEREVRAARNQAMFRSLNEKIRELNEAFDAATDTFVVACECADTSCIEMLTLTPAEYEAVRSEPRHFAVMPGHVYAEVERVAAEYPHYVVVEKVAVAGQVAEEEAHFSQ